MLFTLRHYRRFPVQCAFTYNKRWPNNWGLVSGINDRIMKTQSIER